MCAAAKVVAFVGALVSVYLIILVCCYIPEIRDWSCAVYHLGGTPLRALMIMCGMVGFVIFCLWIFFTTVLFCAAIDTFDAIH